jgi:hypothetical protein
MFALKHEMMSWHHFKRCYDGNMRTTLSIDDDVMERARAVAAKLSTPFKTIVNEALRAGLDQVEQPAKQRRYKTKPHKMGLRHGRNLDNIQELLAQIEGEDSRWFSSMPIFYCTRKTLFSPVTSKRLHGGMASYPELELSVCAGRFCPHLFV